MDPEQYLQYGDEHPAEMLEQPYQEYDEGYLEQLIQQEHLRMANEYSIVNECVRPTLTQGIESIWVLLALCLALRCLAFLKLNEKLLHMMSAVAGFIALWHFYEHSSGYVFLLCVIGYLCLSSDFCAQGGFLSLVCIIFMLSCEKLLVAETEWNKIRGSVMVVAMKLIYIGFEKKNKALESLNPFSYYGYILNPASIIFGPFITYTDYLQLLHVHPITVKWIFNVVKTVILSGICLTWSTCGTSYILPKLGSHKWLDAFKDANAFRFSTYFVSYTSESTCLIMGIGTLSTKKDIPKESEEKYVAKEQNGRETNKEEDRKKDKECDTFVNHFSRSNVATEAVEELRLVQWSRPVSNALAVEIPRSLVEVVTNWNLPMHFWLKNYVFKTSRHFGVFPAILLTYFASALLHGLNFQLSVILFSIGIFAYVENSIRKTLSTTFSACIEARKCKENCEHIHKKGNFWVVCANLAFGFVAVWNLAYLGCLFDNDPDIQERGYSMAHALRKWAALGYLCHYFMLAVFILDKLLKDGMLFCMPAWIKPRQRKNEDLKSR